MASASSIIFFVGAAMASATSSLSLRLFTVKLSCFRPPSTFLPRRPIFLSTSRPLSISFQRIETAKSSPSSPPPLQSASSSAPLQPVEELPEKVQKIIEKFQSARDNNARYGQLIFEGKNLPPLDPRFKTRENKVEGCVSQVWVRAYFDPDGNVVFEADSDAVISKGLAAVLVNALSGLPVDEILRVSPDFVTHLGLKQSLSPGRTNGFLNMLRLMKKKAQLLLTEPTYGSSGTIANGSAVVPEPEFNDRSDIIEESSHLESEIAEVGAAVNGSAVSESKASTSGLGSRGNRIKEKLEKELSPIELDVEDISYQHAGHAGVRGTDGETHFNLRVVSEQFEGKSLIKRHRLVYDLLKEELQSGLHALSIVAKTPSEI